MKTLLITSLLILSGCASTHNSIDVQNGAIGLSQTKIYQCLGLPSKKDTLNNKTYLEYRKERVDRNGVWDCTTSLVLNNNVIESVEITVGKENVFGSSRKMCASALEKCQ